MPLERIPNPFAGRTRESMEGRSKIESYLNKVAKEMKARGVPVGEDFRIQPQEYKNKKRDYLGETVNKDLEYIKEKKQEFAKERSDETERKEAELCELYVTALFNKHFSEKLITVRTSEYDDILRHVDTLIVDRKTGDVVWAFDEGLGISKDKREEVLKRNIGREILTSSYNNIETGGVKIKYGLKLTKNENGQERIEVGQNRHVPVFYIGIPKESLSRVVSEFNPSKDSTSEHERKMLKYILESIDVQITELKSKEEKLHPDLKKSLSRFEDIIEEKERELKDMEGTEEEKETL